MSEPLAPLADTAATALLAAIAARVPLVVAHAVPVPADLHFTAQWLAALAPHIGAGRVPPRGSVSPRDRAAGERRRDRSEAFEYVAVVVAGRERWSLPDDGITHEVAPGSIAYIPAGRAVDIETLAATRLWYVGFAFASWIDLVANTAMIELSRDPAWRAPNAPGDAEPPSVEAAVTAALAALRGLPLP